MKNNVYKRLFIVCLVIMIGIFAGRGVAYSYSILHYGTKTTPAYVQCYSSFSSETKNAIKLACDEWNNAGAGKLLAKSSIEHTETKFNENNKNQITKGKRGTNKYLMSAMNYYYYEDRKIKKSKECDIDINVSFNFGNEGLWKVYDIQNCITHELGHLLGLNDESGSGDTNDTMYYKSSKGEKKKRTLTSDDKNGVKYLY